MKTNVKKSGLEHLELMRKRVEFLIGGRIRNRKKMVEASQHIDKLCRQVKGLSSVEIIRKFRGAI